MSWDNSKISVGKYWLVHNNDSALMALIEMASSKRDSWQLLLRKQISAGFGRNWRVNGEQFAGARLTKYGRVFKSADDKAEYKAAFKKALKNPMKKSLKKQVRKLKKSNTEKINEVVCEAILYSEFQ